jgi:hypothetical protein
MLTIDIINTEYFVMPCNISGDLRKPAQRQTGSRMFGLARVAGRETGLHLRAKNRSLDAAKRNRGITVGSQNGHSAARIIWAEGWPRPCRTRIIEQPTRSLDVAKRNRGITVGSQTGHASMQRSEIEELRWGARPAMPRCSEAKSRNYGGEPDWPCLDAAKRNRGITVGSQTGHASM